MKKLTQDILISLLGVGISVWIGVSIGHAWHSTHRLVIRHPENPQHDNYYWMYVHQLNNPKKTIRDQHIICANMYWWSAWQEWVVTIPDIDGQTGLFGFASQEAAEAWVERRCPSISKDWKEADRP